MLNKIFHFLQQRMIDKAIAARKAGNDKLATECIEMANRWAARIKE
jgi:hypothetical protein